MNLRIEKTANIEKWIITNNITLNDLENILEEYKDGKNILYSLIKNHQTKLYTTVIPNKYERLIGPENISYMKNNEYNKYIILLGDSHVPVNHLCYKAIKSISVEKWISEILATNTKLIDVFVESGKYFDVVEHKDLSINKFQQSLRDCFISKNCSARIHWVDVRKNLKELIDISNFILDYNNDDKLENVINILGTLNLKNILKSSKIDRQFENNKEIYEKYLEKNIKFFEDNYITDIISNLKNVDTKNIGIISLLDLINFLMNFYTIGRIFKKVDCKGYCPDPTFIICYFGKNHTNDIKKFLKEMLSFEEVFNIDNSNINSFVKKILNISNLPQPIFSDVD